MKKINYIYLFLLMIFIASGCRDFVDPVVPYKNEDFVNGAYLRTIQTPEQSVTFDLFNLENSKFNRTVEAIDPQQGQTIESVDVFVSHRRGITVSSEGLVKTIPISDFVMGAEGRGPRATIEITAQEAMAASGKTTADIDGGDSFDIRLALRTVDGRTFTNTNLSGDVSGGAFFSSPFFYRVSVVCPSELEGTFSYSTINVVGGPGAGSCATPLTGSVTIDPVEGTPGAYTVSDVSFGAFACLWGDPHPGGTVRLNDACGQLRFTGSDMYGDSYSIDLVSNNGTNLVFIWENTYGDSGETTLTAPAGFTWPDNLR